VLANLTNTYGFLMITCWPTSFLRLCVTTC